MHFFLRLTLAMVTLISVCSSVVYAGGNGTDANLIPLKDGNLSTIASIDLAHPERTKDVLDKQYTGRSDVVYDLNMTVTPNWDSKTDKDGHALFVVGRNINGRLPNSLSLVVWGGHTLIARLTSSTMDTAQVILDNLDLASGHSYPVHVRWSSNTISLDFNGAHAGDNSFGGQFVWPAGAT